MAEYKGLTIKFRGDASDLSAALARVSRDTKVVQGDLNAIQSALKNTETNSKELSQTLSNLKVEEMGKQVEYAKQRLDLLQQGLPKLEESLAKTRTEMEAVKESIASGDYSGKALSDLEAKLNSLKQREEALDHAVQETNAKIPAQESKVAALAATLESTTVAVAAASSEMGQLAESATKWGDSISGVGDRISSIGDKLSVLSGIVMATFGREVVSSTEEFGNAIAQLGGYLDIGGAQLEEMRGQALEWGKETQFSATEAANAMNELAKGGMTQAQIQGGAMEATLQLAAAGELGMAQAAETAVQAINVFNLEAADASSVADALAGAANKSTAEVSDLSQAFSQIGGAANMAGWNMNEVVGSLALLADRGYSGAEAGTTLKVMLQKLANPTKKASETMNALGIEVYDSQGKMIDAIEVVQRFEQALSGLTDEQKNKALLDIFGQRGINGMTALLAEGSDAMQEYIASTERMGYASEMAKSRMGDLGWALEYLRGEAETAVVTLGTALTPTITDTARALEGMLSWFNNLDKGTQSLIANLGLVAVATGPVLSVFGHMTSGIGDVVSAFGNAANVIAEWRVLMDDGMGKKDALIRSLAEVSVGLDDFDGRAQKVASTVRTLEQSFTTLATGTWVTLLGAAIAGLWGHFTDFHEHAKIVADATRNLSDAIANAESQMGSLASDAGSNAFKVLAEAADESREALAAVADYTDEINSKFASIGNEHAQLDQYVTTIEELAGKSDLTAGELAVLKDAVARYNEITGAAVKITDEQTGALNAQPEAIHAVADAYEDMMRARAYSDLLYDAIKEQAEVEKELAEVTDEYTKIQEKYSIKLGESGWEISTLIGGALDDYRELAANKDALTSSNERLLDSIDHWQDKIKEAGDAESAYNELLKENGLATDDDAEALENLTEETEGATDAQEQLRRAIEDATTALKRQNDEAYTTEKRRLEDIYNDAKSELDKKYQAEKDSQTKTYNAQKDANSKAEAAQKDANTKAENELKKTLSKQYDLRKDALKDEYDLQKDAYKDEYDLLKSALSDEYDLRKSELSKEYNAQKDAYSKQESQLKSDLQKQYNAQKDAYSKQLSEYKKQLSAAEDALKESNADRLAEIKSAHSKEESELKKSLDSQYKIRQKEYSKVYKQWQKENSKILKEAKAQNKAETDAFKAETKARIAAIKEEYEEKKRLYELNDGRTEIDAQIKAIEDEQEAEDAARKQREREEKLSELRLAVERAKTRRTRQDAETALSEYLQQIAEEDADAERQRQIQALKDRRDTIAAETEAVQDGMDAERDAKIAAYEEQREIELAALEETQDQAYELLSEKLSEQLELRKEQQDAQLEQYREELNAELEALKEKHQDEQDAVSKQMDEQLEQLKDANEKRAEAMADWQSQMLEQMSEANNAEVERVKEANAAALEQLKSVQESELKNMKSVQEQQLKDLADEQEAQLKSLATAQEQELESLKDSQERELQNAKDINAANLQQLKDTNAQSLQEMKDSNDQVLQGMKESQSTALTDLKRTQDDALTKLKNDQADAVTALKRSMEDGKTAVDTNAKAANKSLTDNSKDAKDKVTLDGDTIKTKYSDSMDKLFSKVSDIGTKLRSEWTNTTNDTETKSTTNTQKIGSLYDTLFGSFGTKAKTGMDALANGIESGGRTAESKAETAAGNIEGKFNLYDPLYNTGFYSMQGLDNGMWDKSYDVFNTAQEIANGIAERINNTLGVYSPSRVLMETGRYIDEGLAKGLEQGERNVMLTAQSLSEGLADNISPDLELDELHTYTDRYVDEYRTMYDRVEQLARDHMDTMTAMMKVSTRSYDFNATRAIDQALVSVSAAPSVSVVINNPTVRSDRDIRDMANAVVDAINHSDRYAITGGRMR